MAQLNDTKKKKLKSFVLFVKEELTIKKLPKIKIYNGKLDGIKTTASYDYTSDLKLVKVNGKGRALVDILRSIAHELVHHKQWEDGKLKEKPADIGGTIEDEANAVAGQLIKKYALTDDSIYSDI